MPCCLVRLFLLLPHCCALAPDVPRTPHTDRPLSLALALAAFARPMAFYVIFTLLALCSGQTASPTTSPSPTRTPSCSASPGYFCSGGSALICPIGAYCAGGAAANISCCPVTACTVAGLSAQPPCFWNVSTLAGSGAVGSFNGLSSYATFNEPYGLALTGGTLYVGDSRSSCVRIIDLTLSQVNTFAGACGTSGLADGSTAVARFSNTANGVSALNSTRLVLADAGNTRVRLINEGAVTSALTGLSNPCGVSFVNASALLVTDTGNSRVLMLNMNSGLIAATYGNGVATFADGLTSSASFNNPISSIASGNKIFVADWLNHRVRVIDTALSSVLTLAGNGLTSVLNQPVGLAFLTNQTLVVTEYANHRVTFVDIISGTLIYIAGSTAASFTDGFGAFARFNFPIGVAVFNTGVLFVADRLNNRIRQMTCVPCPASFFCFSGAPVLCPAGSYCPLGSINATACPTGSLSNAGASTCTLCPAGTFTSEIGSTSCQQCPGGHFCPAGSSSWAHLNCGRGNFCPDGSGSPTPCPFQVSPPGGWGTLQVQGPAFLVETALCLNHCFWNLTSGDGMLSKC